MANNAYDRTTIGLRERPVSADFNRNVSQADRSLRDTLMRLMSARSLTAATGVPYTGFLGDGFRAVPTSPIGMSVQLTAGLGFFYDPINLPFDLGALDLEGVDDRSPYKPMLLTAPQAFTVPAAPTTGNSRIDIIEAQYSRQQIDLQVRKQLDPDSKAFVDHQFAKTLSWALDGLTGMVSNPGQSVAALSYKVGTTAPTGTQAEPLTSVGYTKVATIEIGANVTTIDRNSISDQRAMLTPSGTFAWSARWRLQWNGGSPIVIASKIVAPQGVHVSLVVPGGAVRANAIVYVLGGAIQASPMAISVGPDLVAGVDFGATEGMMTFLRPTVPAAIGGSHIGGNTASLALGTPSVLTGTFANFVSQEFQCRYQSGGTTNVTNTILEDVDVQATGCCSWVQ